MHFKKIREVRKTKKKNHKEEINCHVFIKTKKGT